MPPIPVCTNRRRRRSRGILACGVSRILLLRGDPGKPDNNRASNCPRKGRVRGHFGPASAADKNNQQTTGSASRYDSAITGYRHRPVAPWLPSCAACTPCSWKVSFLPKTEYSPANLPLSISSCRNPDRRVLLIQAVVRGEAMSHGDSP